MKRLVVEQLPTLLIATQMCIIVNYCKSYIMPRNETYTIRPKKPRQTPTNWTLTEYLFLQPGDCYFDHVLPLMLMLIIRCNDVKLIQAHCEFYVYNFFFLCIIN